MLMDALEQSNEYLGSIRVYIGWFWWILIGIPIILIIIAVVGAVLLSANR
jgi:hypothetical protein